jgi:hypothetical protein
LNNVLVKSVTYTGTAANWTSASTFYFGAYQYASLGYSVSDDIIDEFAAY